MELVVIDGREKCGRGGVEVWRYAGVAKMRSNVREVIEGRLR